MAWRHLAAGAAGVVAAVGFGGHAAAADENGSAEPSPDTNTPPPGEPGEPVVSGEQADKLALAAALAEVVNALPAPKPKPVTPAETPEAAQTLMTLPPLTASTIDAVLSPNLMPSPERLARADSALASWSAAERRLASSHSSPGAASVTQAPSAPTAPPVDDTSSGKATSPGPVGSATTTSSSTNTATPALPPSVGGAAAPQAWLPASVETTADQRIAQAWRGTPVRGPPPGVASALGNDGRTTIYQVSVVDGPGGFEVSISSQQAATVNNRGFAAADAYGAGSATSTGDLARTSIYQVSVVVQRGTGTASVVQNASVDNLGVGVAASAGPANATAVGNASSTTVNQTAVVLILGSGDATLTQSTDVTNGGVATAVAFDQPATATGSSATTDVTQIAVLLVHDDDVTVQQSSTTVNLGSAIAGGGTAVGNNSTNTVTQTTVWH